MTVNTDGQFSYTPDTGYAGSDSFTFIINDGYQDSAPATISITVKDTAPVASDKSYSTDANTSLSGQLQASDSDNGQTLTYSIVSQPPHGSVNLDASSGRFTYAPAHDYSGTDSFTFKVNDGTLDSNTATVTFTIAAPKSSGGGGAFGLLGLALLAGLALLIALLRKSPAPEIRRSRHRP